MIMKIRMKISYSAFIKNQTVFELLITTIYDVYIERKKAGLILDPWPIVNRKHALNMILTGVYQDAERDHRREDETKRPGNGKSNET